MGDIGEIEIFAKMRDDGYDIMPLLSKRPDGAAVLTRVLTMTRSARVSEDDLEYPLLLDNTALIDVVLDRLMKTTDHSSVLDAIENQISAKSRFKYRNYMSSGAKRDAVNWAALSGNASVFRTLINLGYDYFDNEDVMEDAVRSGKAVMVKLALEYEFPIPPENRILALAVETNAAKLVRFLVREPKISPILNFTDIEKSISEKTTPKTFAFVIERLFDGTMDDVEITSVMQTLKRTRMKPVNRKFLEENFVSF